MPEKLYVGNLEFVGFLCSRGVNTAQNTQKDGKLWRARPLGPIKGIYTHFADARRMSGAVPGYRVILMRICGRCVTLH